MENCTKLRPKLTLRMVTVTRTMTISSFPVIVASISESYISHAIIFPM